MTAVPTAKFTDDGVDPAQHLAVLLNGQGYRAIEQVIGGEAAVTTGEAQLEGKRLGQRFFQREVDDGQISRLGTGEFKRELQSAAVGHVSLLENEVDKSTTDKAGIMPDAVVTQ